MARLEKAHVRRSGRCATVIDEADTTALQPGHYTYRLMLKTDTEEAWLSVDAPLQIQPAAGLEPGSNNASVSPDISTQKP